jgi:hypothetical protein
MTGAPKSESVARLETLVAMTTRLTDAVAADVAALEKGRVAGLAMTDPEIERLSVLYGREVAAARGAIKDAPTALLRSLKDGAAKLKALLKRHERLVSAMRSASEGMVKAVAEEVERTRLAAMPYSASPQARRAAAGAIVYNRVV